jgi:hypothetical protein
MILTRRCQRMRRVRGLLCELLLVGLVALGVGRDVSEASGQCNYSFGCSESCVDNGETSTETLASSQRYFPGSQSPMCGTQYTFAQTGCQGNSVTSNINCPGNCCQ